MYDRSFRGIVHGCHADVPTAPEGPLEVTDITSDTALLHWKPPKDDGGIDLTGYIIERRDAKHAVWTKVGSVDGTTLNFKVTGLQEGMEYLFRVFAENEVGVSEPLERDAKVVPKSQFGRFLMLFPATQACVWRV